MMKRQGFTLLELLMVVAVMGLLGTVATAGYYAAASSMEVRGAQDSVRSFIQTAKQRAATDHVPTCVYFYNKLLREGSKSHNAVVAGVAVAVRAGGRVSCVATGRGKMSGKFLVDEFNDIERGRPSFGGTQGDERLDYLDSSSSGTRLYRIDMPNKKVEFSQVCDYVVERSKIGENCEETMPTAGISNTNIASFAYAFRIDKNAKNAKNVDWKAGDLYGYEIAILQLPHNMIFGRKIPEKIDASMEERPEDPIFYGADGKKKSGGETVEMAICRNLGDADGGLKVYDTFKSHELKKD